MEKTHIQQTLAVLKQTSPKRNFTQSIDLIINLKDLDLKKPENKVDVYAPLHYSRGKPVKICALVDVELLDSAKKHFDTTISVDEFGRYQDKKTLKKLAKDHHFFIAQANIMPKVATAFGKALGPRGKMPNPKAGCVVPPNANLEALKDKLQKTVRIRIESAPLFQTSVGNEATKEEELVDTILTLYKTLVSALPNDIHNIKEMFLKTTMGKPIRVEEQNAAPLAGGGPLRGGKRPSKKAVGAEKNVSDSPKEEGKGEKKMDAPKEPQEATP
ncbi:50S ribosomal protein L1 [Candidatus Woesearchaeota archaeon]|nr:50S ribosomal protein L1 [Candidatus Woesearchaeota archaeon]